MSERRCTHPLADGGVATKPFVDWDGKIKEFNIGVGVTRTPGKPGRFPLFHPCAVEEIVKEWVNSPSDSDVSVGKHCKDCGNGVECSMKVVKGSVR